MWRPIHSKPRPVVWGGFCCTKTWWHPEPSHISSHISVCKDVDVKPHLLPIDSEVFNLRSTVTSPEAILDIKAGSSGHEEKQHSSMYVERMWTQRVTRTNPQNRSPWSMRKTRKGITNKELLTWKWDLPPPPSFWHERRNGEGMRAFSKQPSGQTSPPPKRQVVCQCHILF